MRVERSAARAAALGVACLTLGACAATFPPPEQPGQVGQITRAGKPVTGVMVAVHAPAAERCTYDGAESFRKREGGYHDFLFVSGKYSNPANVRIDCRTADGQPLDRTLAAPFNGDGFRLSRTATTIGAVLGGGPIGLISGPLAAEMSKNTWRQPPVLIHVPSRDDLATEDARLAAREAAVGRWSDLAAALEKECDAKTRSNKQVLIAYACPKGFFSELRDTDLAIFKAALTPPVAADTAPAAVTEATAAPVPEVATASESEEPAAAAPEPAATPAT